MISSVALGTDLFAGGWLGIIGGTCMFAGGIWYLERQRVKARDNGEHFVPGTNDSIMPLINTAAVIGFGGVVTKTPGFDSLPHCGAVVAMLSITGLTHKEAYRDVGMITVVIPVLSTLIVMAVVALP